MLEVVEIDMNTGSEQENMIEEGIELDAAGDEVSLEKDGSSELDVLNAANLATTTPDTGAQTWVLILLTLVINSFYYLSRRKQRA